MRLQTRYLPPHPLPGRLKENTRVLPPLRIRPSYNRSVALIAFTYRLIFLTQRTKDEKHFGKPEV